LQEEEWELGHLAGRELVADSFTKVVDGPAFERALQDLCIKADCDVKKGHGGGSHNSINARVAMLVGATLLSSAAATTEEVGEDELPWFLDRGFNPDVRGRCLCWELGCPKWHVAWNRLQRTSGGQSVDEAKGQDATP
jgi:hypothetical protein